MECFLLLDHDDLSFGGNSSLILIVLWISNGSGGLADKEKTGPEKSFPFSLLLFSFHHSISLVSHFPPKIEGKCVSSGLLRVYTSSKRPAR